MGRIVSRKPEPDLTLEDAPPNAKLDGYFERLIKYIPVEATSLVLTLNAYASATKGTEREALQWVIVLAAFGVTTLVIVLASKPDDPWKPHLAISIGAMLVWLYNILGPTNMIPFQVPNDDEHHGLKFFSVLGPAILVIYTTFLAIYRPPPAGK